MEIRRESEYGAWLSALFADKRLPYTKSVVVFLNQYPGAAYCDECLTTRMPIQLTDLIEALKAVEHMRLFSREKGRCFFCHSERTITGYLLLGPDAYWASPAV